jgi:proline-rich tail region repeat protein
MTTPPEEPNMRRIFSTNAPVDVSAKYADQVDTILEKAVTLRETVYLSTNDQKDFYVFVDEYNAPDGTGNRWATEYHDFSSREVMEFDDRASAEAHYEKTVRAAATAVGLGTDSNPAEPGTFEVIDVPGIPGWRP